MIIVYLDVISLCLDLAGVPAGLQFKKNNCFNGSAGTCVHIFDIQFLVQ